MSQPTITATTCTAISRIIIIRITIIGL